MTSPNQKEDGGPAPLRVSYDEYRDILTINDKKYAGDIFRQFGIVTRNGHWIRVELNSFPEIVTIRTASEEAIRSGQATAKSQKEGKS